MEPVKWHTIRSRIPIAFNNCKSNKHRNKFLFVRFVAIFFVQRKNDYAVSNGLANIFVRVVRVCVCLRTMHTNRVCSDQLYRLSYISLLYRTYRLPNCHSTHSIMLIMIVILARALKKCADAIVHVTVVLCKWLMAHSTAEPAGHGKIPQNMYTRSLYCLTIIGSVVRACDASCECIGPQKSVIHFMFQFFFGCI